MIVNGKKIKALFFKDNTLKIIDQRKLPFKFEIYTAKTVDDVVYAIKEMIVRGAPAMDGSWQT